MRDLLSELLLALFKKVKSECFATQNAILTAGISFSYPCLYLQEI